MTGACLRSRSALPALALAAATTQVASAATWIEFTFEGTVNFRFGDNPDHPWNGVQIGDPMSFSYVIDIDQPDQNNSPTSGQYDVASAALTFGGVTLVPETILPLQVRLSGSLGFDEVVIAMEPFGEVPTDAAAFRLYGFNNLPDDGIPIDFDLEEFGLRGLSYGDGVALSFSSQFESYSYQIVPAPGAIVALAAFIFRTGTRRRSGRH